ncbi:MAG: succinylglutamate desuccinylase/aspartoacylase family protein, partial [Mesorhizobium sp.]|nr:succinylglutamate desuccinylase/aspartoacylase family protein [Mesorhizobium sp.]
MKKTIETIAGDTEGVAYEFPVYRFAGSSSEAPTAYLQAALHAGELPGVVAIDQLMPKLRKAEAEGRIRGDITLVPAANPVGRAQYHFGELQGRFHLGTRTNFNRDFPLLDTPDASTLKSGRKATADRRLKERLIQLSMGHDIVLDLHCDDEGVAYLYVPGVLWPAMADVASAMGVAAVILWDGASGSSFDEASLHPWLKAPADKARLDRRVVTTVEYRGIHDVERGFAEGDGEGLYRVLVARGVVEDTSVAPPAAFGGLVSPIENTELIQAPRAGAILFDVKPGDRVTKGQRVATIVHSPGEEDSATEVFAPQAGYVFTRRSHRSIRAGDDLIKLAGDGPS